MNSSYKYFEFIFNLFIFLIFFSETQINLNLYTSIDTKDFYKKNLKKN